MGYHIRASKCIMVPQRNGNTVITKPSSFDEIILSGTVKKRGQKKEEKIEGKYGARTIQELDRLTCRFSKSEFIELLRETGEITNQDTFSIVSTITNNGTEYNTYYKVMFNAPEMIEVIDHLKKDTKLVTTHNKNTNRDEIHETSFYCIDRSSEMFEKEFKWFIAEIIKYKDNLDVLFDEIFEGKLKELPTYAKNYLETYDKDAYTSDERETKEENEKNLRREFSCYKTFRVYYITKYLKKTKDGEKMFEKLCPYTGRKEEPTKEDKKTNINGENIVTLNRETKYTGPIQVEKKIVEVPVYSDTDYDEDDQEEFFDEEEIEEMYGSKEGYERFKNM